MGPKTILKYELTSKTIPGGTWTLTGVSMTESNWKVQPGMQLAPDGGPCSSIKASPMTSQGPTPDLTVIYKVNSPRAPGPGDGNQGPKQLGSACWAGF